MGSKKTNNTDNVPAQEWSTYFTDLSNSRNQQSQNPELRNDIDTFLSELHNEASTVPDTPDQQVLLEPFTRDELSRHLKGLKSNKSTGPDGINEMFKSAQQHLMEPLLMIYNDILKTGDYPTEWKSSLITPIHKKDSKAIASNYGASHCRMLLADFYRAPK